MKLDFEKAAEEHIQKYAGEITGSVFTIARSDIYNLREESFLAGCEYTYSINKETIERLEKENKELKARLRELEDEIDKYTPDY